MNEAESKVKMLKERAEDGLLSALKSLRSLQDIAVRQTDARLARYAEESVGQAIRYASAIWEGAYSRR